ncbi:MAG TPA: endolytic transglycosylase MltG [Candidatus Saccharimonadales bacterium]|nr:endolytic transglycosylase MltG [Candidatus Saccharimonadales bacterium]
MKRWWLIGAGVVAGLLIVAAYASYRYELRPANTKLAEPIAFGIDPGQKVNAISAKLQQAGIIRSRWAFNVYVTLHGLRRKIQAGYYELSPADTAATNAKIIARGIVVNKAFLVREGETTQQIEAAALSQWLRGGDLPAAIEHDTYNGSFLIDRPAGASLEGYLFPDTYEISPSTTPHQLVQAMLNNFGTKITSETVAGCAKQGLNLHQCITMASIIEREVAHAADRPIVAQVFLKRLRIGMALESDVTALYGAQLNGQTNVTNIRSIISPYNTYLHPGLPPGPIANPGLGAINAVINPASTDYLYFVADKDGNTHFARTFAEHQANVAKYL